MSADLMTWLLEQLAADEAVERGKRKWRADTFTKRCPRCRTPVDEIEGTFDQPKVTLLPCRDELTREEWEVFVDMQPGADEFRLAVIASTRAILAIHGKAHRCPNHIEGDVESCRTLVELASPYRDRAGSTRRGAQGEEDPGRPDRRRRAHMSAVHR